MTTDRGLAIGSIVLDLVLNAQSACNVIIISLMLADQARFELAVGNLRAVVDELSSIIEQIKPPSEDNMAKKNHTVEKLKDGGKPPKNQGVKPSPKGGKKKK